MDSTLTRHLTLRVPEPLFNDLRDVRKFKHINIGSLVRAYLEDFVSNQHLKLS